jgi:hypothetical protein
MSMRQVALSLLASFAFFLAGQAQGADPETETLKKQVQEMEQRIRSLQDQLDRQGAAKVPAPVAVQPAPTVAASRSYANISLDGLFAVGTSTAEDVQNVEGGGHDPNQRGFTVQNVELTLDGAVDPYFKAQANVVLQIDQDGENTIELEEAFAITTSLPANLQVKAGQYFTEFGRLNPQHPHTWDFVDQPLVNSRFLGGDGLRNPGARVSWLAPTPFYAELFLSVQNSQGETAFSFRNTSGETVYGHTIEKTSVDSLGDLLYVPRAVASFDLTDTQTVVMGASAAFGPNGTGQDSRTQIYGADVFWKWKPLNARGGWPFVKWQTEAMFRRYEAARDEEAGLPAETLKDWGVYSQLVYGLVERWVAGLRGDYVTGDSGALDPDPERATRWRLSPDLTYYPSEFSKVRFQYNYDNIEDRGPEHSVWMQFEFLIGAHAAHKF